MKREPTAIAPAPRPRRGSCTVEPIRDKRDITAMKGVLAHRARDLALFVVGIHTGFRGTDLLGLRWGDVLTDDGSIALRVSIVETKTNKRRTMPLQDNARRALGDWLRASSRVDRAAYVFPSRQGGGKITTGRLNQLLNGWADEAGVTGHFGAHTLRKTFGYHLRMAGYDIAMLMEIFGHSSQSITRRYCGINQDEINAAALKLNL